MFLIAATGWGQLEDKARAIASGFDHHLTKPVDPDEMQSCYKPSSAGTWAPDAEIAKSALLCEC